MSSIDAIFSFFTTITGMISLAIVVVGAVVIYYVYTTGNTKGTILLLRPRDKRGEYIPILKEEDKIIQCKPKDGIKRRFIKGGSSWVVNKKPVFLAVEGSAVTTAINPIEKRSIPVDMFLREAWGDEFCDKKIPKRIASLVSTPWLVGVEPERIDLGSSLEGIRAEDVLAKEDAIMLETLAQAAEKGKERTDWVKIGLGMFGGMGVAYLLLGLGWLPKFG